MTDYNRPKLKPIILYFGIAVLLAIATIAGAYILEAKQINDQRQQAATAAHNALVAQIRGAIPLCKALILMDDAKDGATNASSDPNSYGHRLSKAITELVQGTKCRTLIADVNKHEPYAQIERQLK